MEQSESRLHNWISYRFPIWRDSGTVKVSNRAWEPALSDKVSSATITEVYDASFITDFNALFRCASLLCLSWHSSTLGRAGQPKRLLGCADAEREPGRDVSRYLL